MAMDGLTLAAVRFELERDCTGAKIEKIYQPDRDELVLLLRGNRRLLLSANAGSCRVQLTTAASPNPPSPPCSAC